MRCRILEDPLATVLADGIPFGIAVGNHDQSPIGDPRRRDSTTQLQPVLRRRRASSAASYYGGHFGTNNDNHYELFSAGGMDFIIIHFEYDTSRRTPAVLAWADGAAQAHPGPPRASSSATGHQHAATRASFSTRARRSTTRSRRHPNLFLMLCGHVCDEGRRRDVFDGNVVHSLLSDYQCRRERRQRLAPHHALHAREPTRSTCQDVLADAGPVRDRRQQPVHARPTRWAARRSRPSAPSAASPPAVCARAVWPNLANGTAYEWYATASDGVHTTRGPIRSFITAVGGGTCTTTTSAATGTRAPVTPARRDVPAHGGRGCLRRPRRLHAHGRLPGRHVRRDEPGRMPGDGPVPRRELHAGHRRVRAVGADGRQPVRRRRPVHRHRRVPGRRLRGDRDARLSGRHRRGRHQRRRDDPRSTGFETDTVLHVDHSAVRHAYLRVRVDGPAAQTITSAVLRLHVAGRSASSSNSGGRIHASACDWNEDTLTWTSKPSPPFEAAVLDAASGPVIQGQVVTFDVTTAIQTGVRCFAIDTTSTNAVKYRSLEAASGTPELLVTTTCPCGPDTTTTSTTIVGTSTTTSTIMGGAATATLDADVYAYAARRARTSVRTRCWGSTGARSSGRSSASR